MGLVSGDIVQIIDFQNISGEESMNVYYYRYLLITPAGDEVYEELANNFIDTVIVPVTAIQAGSVIHTTLEIRNLSNGVDLYTQEVDDVGDAPGDPAPSFLSYGFLLRRSSLLTRNGYKRFGGVSESYVSGNTNSVPSGAVDDIIAGLEADINIGIVPTFSQIILKRPIEVPLVDPVYSDINQVEFRGIGTQNTRKPS